MALKKHHIGYIEGTLSAVLNVALFALKLWVGRSADSVSMIADAWHTLSDTLTSVVVLFGFWFVSRPEDDEHPFGHGRAEVISAIAIGTILALVGINFAQDSIARLRDHQMVVFGKPAFIIFGISVVLKEAMAQFSIRAGKHIQASSLIADGWHHRSDAIASGLILVGAVVGSSIWWIDSAMGIGVSLLILYTAYEIIRDAANTMLGENPSDELMNDITSIIENRAPQVADVHHVHMHRYGDHVEITLHARMPEETSLFDAHKTATELEARLREVLKIDATFHLEPYEES